MRTRLSGGHHDAPLLVYVGRLGLEKKLANLRHVLDRNPGARLALVGEGPAEASLRQVFRGYPVHFAGQMSGDALSDAYASTDVFVMPSDSETLGFVVLEAMASAVPVGGVAKGGVQDLIEDGKNGFLVPYDSEMIDVSDRVKLLIEDKAMRDEMAAHARAWTERWSWRASASRLRNVQYRAAIALRKARGEGLLRKHIPELEEVYLQHYAGVSSQTTRSDFTGSV
jgi:sulfoquinovosyltransferase